LARRHCVSCHEFTPPEILPKKSWNFLLTFMGLRLGIDDDSYLVNPTETEKAVIDARRLSLRLWKRIPETPAMGPEDWKALRQFYAENAPETLPESEYKLSSMGLVDLFVEKKHQYQVKNAVTSLVHIDEANRQVLIGDSRNQVLTTLDSDLNIAFSTQPSDYTFWVDAVSTKEGVHLLSIGDLFAYFVGGKLGRVSYLEKIGFMYLTEEVLLDGLYRPSAMEFADMNNDGVDELLVCGYGAEGGDFSIYEREEEGAAFKSEPINTLHQNSGAIQCDTHDLNNDGLKDIVLLISDFDEQLCLFINDGKGGYEKKVIFDPLPSWGYVNFQLVDMNQDGLVDIVASNGDGPDSDPYATLKPQHGIRIYLNDGNLGFAESYFYPMHGCYQLEAHDYDQDGDIDIASCSFYPEFESDTSENFVYLEQTETMKFSPKHHPAADQGRWMTMDAGDLDQDGDIDIVLGATYIPIGVPASRLEAFNELLENGPTILFLENKLVD